ncbi:RAB acceptor [Cryptosporidium canis]|uniref:PRA1 family protein n=1 Tax=Cryptosporidium canis TaxID=195482 RepID=A0ABQ8P230_9CRYT|nr:RAB acceptor [Cryptosporidium canis]KAJ1607280.1 RAB acceptor [Cryptosporidium canis]
MYREQSSVVLDSPVNGAGSGLGSTGASSMSSNFNRLESMSRSGSKSGGVAPKSSEYGPTVQQILETYESIRLKAQTISKRKLRSWEGDFFCLSSFQKVSQPKEITDRLERNLRYFLLNYIVIILGMTALSLILNPVSLIIIILATFSSAFVASRPTDMVTLPGDHPISKKVALYTIAGVSTVIILVFSGALLFTSLAVSLVLVCIHAAIHVGKANYDQVASLESEV